MADAPVKKAPLGYASVLAVVTYIAANWDDLRPILDDVLLLVGAIVLHPLMQAAVIGTLIGAGIAWRLPHDFPSRFQERDTVVKLRWYCSGLTWVVTFALYPRPLGIAVGAIAALGGQYLLVCGVRTFYRLFPGLKPQSLKPNAAPGCDATAGGETAGGDIA